MYQGNQRLLLALAVNIIHIFSHGIFYPLGNEAKSEFLRPKLEDNILKDDIYRECFRLYLSQDKIDHLLSFWEDCQLYKNYTFEHPKRIKPMLKNIIETYLTKSSSKYIELPEEITEQIYRYNNIQINIKENADDSNNGNELLDKAVLYVYKKLEIHFPSFLKSKQAFYVDVPYRWLDDFKNYHNALQYSVRTRMCEYSVTDKATGFAYQMGKGRISNPNSCFQLSDIPIIFGQVLKHDIYRDNNAKQVRVPQHVGLIPHYIDKHGIDHIEEEGEEEESDNVIPRTNLYIPVTSATSGGNTAYGFATLADNLSTGNSTGRNKSDGEDEYF